MVNKANYLKNIRQRKGYSFADYQPEIAIKSGYPVPDTRATQTSLLVLAFIFYLSIFSVSLFSLSFLSTDTHWLTEKIGLAIFIGYIGLWRWSLFIIHYIRALIYRIFVFPILNKSAEKKISSYIHPPLGIVFPTFKENPKITREAISSIVLESKKLSRPVYLSVVSTEEEIASIGVLLTLLDPYGYYIRFLPTVDPSAGKRGALAVGLQALRDKNFPLDGIIALMDGDSFVGENTFKTCLGFFMSNQRLGALTTNEVSICAGPKWFQTWLDIRFMQRHLSMMSFSLSKRVLCLTGRFSLFRAQIILDPSFIELIYNDSLNDWLWGKINFLSGDDKTSWYYTMKMGWDMIYIPNINVTTVEIIKGSGLQRLYQNLRRYAGNMLRNGTRVLSLNPFKIGLFLWHGILDQRISMWTVLITPSLIILSICFGDYEITAVITLWLVFSRSTYLLSLFLISRRLPSSFICLPIILVTQWFNGLTKIYTLMFLNRQRWANRDKNSLGRSSEKLFTARSIAATLILLLQFCLFANFMMFLYTSFLRAGVNAF